MPKETDIPDFPTNWKRPSFDNGRSYEIELITPGPFPKSGAIWF
jgi:hypothetical protein